MDENSNDQPPQSRVGKVEIVATSEGYSLVIVDREGQLLFGSYNEKTLEGAITALDNWMKGFVIC